jgi:rhodanese-related sulfurtransferase
MTEPEKITPAQAVDLAASGRAHLVFAEDDETKFNERCPEKAVSLAEFLTYLIFISRKQEIIFYCDSEGARTAVDKAIEFKKMGYNRVKVVDGGLQGWEDAGLPLYRLEKDKEDS